MTIPDETSEHMYRYIWSIIDSRNCKLYRIGGIVNHIYRPGVEVPLWGTYH